MKNKTMGDPLAVVKIIPNKNGIQVILQNKKICKIASHRRILIRYKIITPSELKIGDKILTYGFDVEPVSVYNKYIEKNLITYNV